MLGKVYCIKKTTPCKKGGVETLLQESKNCSKSKISIFFKFLVKDAGILREMSNHRSRDLLIWELFQKSPSKGTQSLGKI